MDSGESVKSGLLVSVRITHEHERIINSNYVIFA
jgi:hypothetical protein